MSYPISKKWATAWYYQGVKMFEYIGYYIYFRSSNVWLSVVDTLYGEQYAFIYL